MALAQCADPAGEGGGSWIWFVGYFSTCSWGVQAG